MPLIYRSMVADGEKPRVGCSAVTLGVRRPPDKNADLPVEADGTVHPNTGGMSVAPAWRQLPLHRICERLRDKVEGARGRLDAVCWRMGSGAFVAESVSAGLFLRPDSNEHGTVQPDRPMPLSEYEGNLAGTREQWVKDEN